AASPRTSRTCSRAVRSRTWWPWSAASSPPRRSRVRECPATGPGRARAQRSRGAATGCDDKRPRGPPSAVRPSGPRSAGPGGRGTPPARLTPAAVYPSLVADFGLTPSQELHLTGRDETYYAEAPPVAGRLTGPARSAYEFLWRFHFTGAETLPPPDRDLNEEE